MEQCAKAWLKSRHIDLNKLVKIISTLKGAPDDNLDKLSKNLDTLLESPQIRDVILLGITLDVYAENILLPEPLLGRVIDPKNTFTLHHALSLSILSSFDPQVTDTYHELLSKQPSVIDQLIDAHTYHRFLRPILAMILSLMIEGY